MVSGVKAFWLNAPRRERILQGMGFSLIRCPLITLFIAFITSRLWGGAVLLPVLLPGSLQLGGGVFLRPCKLSGGYC